MFEDVQAVEIQSEDVKVQPSPSITVLANTSKWWSARELVLIRTDLPLKQAYNVSFKYCQSLRMAVRTQESFRKKRHAMLNP